MSGDWQLDPPPTPTEGDKSVTEQMDDGTVVTSWPDGTSRVDYPDGSATITYPDFAVLNIYPDGSRTLTDAQGVSYDPYSGAPLGKLEVPLYGAAEIQDILAGGKILGTLGEAKELVEAAADSVRGAVDPTEWVGQVVNAILEVVRALETEERGCFLRGWSYALLYGALDMAGPPEPVFAGSLGGPDQDELNRATWWDGVTRAQADLSKANRESPSGTRC
ncbi:hypothetical protein [Streptomyces sp. NPDC002133]|uniref:hypothetical protein n=1 Tax=Streptomyces sp. NPDC002133 TaxID=3154409 RepID=UPI0033259F1D